MLKKAVLVCGWKEEIPSNYEGDVVGIDKGALLLARKGIKMEFAIGDFDSITSDEQREVEKYSKQMIVLSARKDVSDTEAALIECTQRGYEEITLWGALGGRFDHAWVNLLLLKKYPSLRLIDAQNEVITLDVGSHEIQSRHKYVSIFALQHSEISLDGFEYPLDHTIFESDTTLGLSNEIPKEKARIIVHSGRLMVIFSQDK